MIKFEEEKLLKNIQGAVNLRKDINDIVDNLYKNGISNICWLGIGGTYASSMQVVVHMKEKTTLEVFYENAATFNTTGNKRVTNQTLVIISSVSGTTSEVIESVEKCKKIGAHVLGFIDQSESPLAKLVDSLIVYPMNEQLKFFMVADRIMYLRGEFPDYEEFYQEIDNNFAKDIVDVYKTADTFGKEFAEKHYDDNLHYFVGSGNQWGATYSYAMCYWEEQHWIKTRAIEAQEFFHGMLEIIDRDTPITVYITEDSQRKLSQRVAEFLPRICANYTIIDSKDYAMPGFSEKYRGFLSPFIIHAVNERIDAHIEKINCHPMEIRRYYRCLNY